MKFIITTTLLCLMTLPYAAAAAPNFSGTWVLNPSKGANLGMMASMQLVETIKQTGDRFAITDAGTMNGQTQSNEVLYDLNGKPGTNLNPMGQKNETVSKWVGGRLVTTWTAEGAIAGTRTLRTETRSISADGKTMTVESVRGDSPAIIMVFDRK
jgi:hypothetical protein